MKKISSTIILIALVITLTAQDFAVKQLEKSPRHHEWVDVKSGDRNIRCFVIYPEISAKATAVIVIHENKGLTDWVRSFSDQLAGEGYLVIAPDLLSDFSPGIKHTGNFGSPDEATNAIYQLKPEQVTADLQAVQAYIAADKASNGKTVVAGFCWGGMQSFRYATNNQDIKAALVFYGSAPDKAEDLRRIKVPVYGFYGENDQRINAGIEGTQKLMKQEGKKYDYKIYPGAGHGYMRQGEDPAGSPENRKARDDSWKWMLEILKKA
jgi:carboxymethylenebutenolidase